MIPLRDTAVPWEGNQMESRPQHGAIGWGRVSTGYRRTQDCVHAEYAGELSRSLEHASLGPLSLYHA